jgi:hypothetical protein
LVQILVVCLHTKAKAKETKQNGEGGDKIKRKALLVKDRKSIRIGKLNNDPLTPDTSVSTPLYSTYSK